MRIPVTYVCTFTDFDETVIGIQAPDARKAAEVAAKWWERDAEDCEVLAGLDTLRVRVQAGEAVSYWEVLGVASRYVAKPMPECKA